jgi:serine/threonine-protein kinase SRPK3
MCTGQPQKTKYVKIICVQLIYETWNVNLLKWARIITRRTPLLPLHFPKTGFHVVSDDQALDEEQYEYFRRGLYYPVNIGDVFKSKYQVLGKLGCGVTSTLWLARNLEAHPHVTLKVYTRDGNPHD